VYGGNEEYIKSFSPEISRFGRIDIDGRIVLGSVVGSSEHGYEYFSSMKGGEEISWADVRLLASEELWTADIVHRYF
jgi:hypothetical protein